MLLSPFHSFYLLNNASNIIPDYWDIPIGYDYFKMAKLIDIRVKYASQPLESSAEILTNSEFLDGVEKNILNTLVTNAYKEASRDLTTDTILYKLNSYELSVEKRVRADFEKKGFALNTLTSGLTPPASMVRAIEARNNASIEAQTVQQQLQAAIYQIKKDSIQRISNKIKSDGLTPEILQLEYIKTLPNIKGVIITDGRTPIIIDK
jgi:hypothetical protein